MESNLLILLGGLLLAILIDLSFGDPPNKYHPVAAMGHFIQRFIHQHNRGSGARRFLFGTIMVLLGSFTFALPAIFFQLATEQLAFWWRAILTGLFLYPVFAFRQLLIAGNEVLAALNANDLPEARRLTAWHLVSRETEQLDEQKVSSAVVESLAENLTDSFFAPLFFYALAGLPFAWMYRFVNTADAMVGYHHPDYEYFGKFAARLDDVLNWLPARICGLLLVISAWFCQFDYRNAWQTMLGQYTLTASPNAGWTMAAAAGALGITLDKEGYYRLEGGPNLPARQDITRAIKLLRVAQYLTLVFTGGLIVIIHLIV